MANFLTPLELEYIDGTKWKLTAEFDYHLGAPDGFETVQIPAGFITDFASVPRPLWSAWPPTGTYGKAAVVHDWLYQQRTFLRIDARKQVYLTERVDRAEADRILLEAMEVLGVGWFSRHVIYWGVRAGGGHAWNKYRRQEEDV